MDPLSHALLGAASGYSVTRNRERWAALAGLAAAMLPDVDVLIGSDSDPLLALEYHRNFTHSFAAAPVGALIVAGILWLLLRGRSGFRDLYLPALAGYVSAILLDTCTSYGTQLLWPFSDRRFAWSVVAVIDPIVTLVLLFGVVAALRSGAPRSARVSLVLVLVYLGFGWFQRERAESLVERAAKARGHVIAQHEVKPTLGNLLLWRSVYLTGKEYVVDAPRVGFSTSLYPGGTVRRVLPIDLVPPLALNSVQAADVVRFGKVSEGYLARDPSRPNVIGDVRYSMLPNSVSPLWAIEITPEHDDEHVQLHTYRNFTKQDRERFFAMLKGVSPASLAPAPAEEKDKRRVRR